MNKKRKQKNTQKQTLDETKQIKSLMNEGKQLYDKATKIEQIEQALRMFTSAIAKAATSQVLFLNQIYHLKGLCEFKLKRYEKAERDFQQAITISDDKNKIELYNSLGKCKLQQALIQESDVPAKTLNIQLQQSIKCFQKALEFSNQTDGEAYFNLGMIYKKMRKNFQAIKQFGSALKYMKYQDQYQAYIEKGICYRDIGEIQNSINDFLKALQINKDDPYAYFHLGINYLLNLNYESALQKLSVAIELNKTQPQFHNYKGLVLYMSGQYEECLQVFHQALKFYDQKGLTSSQVGQCWYNVGNALINLSRNDQAVQAFQMAKLYHIDDDLSIKLLYAEGRTFQLINSPLSIQKFQQCLQKQISSNTNDLYLATLFHLGNCQAKYYYYNEAIESFSKIIEADCNDKCVYEQRGKTYLKNQMYKQALNDFQFVSSIDQSYPDIYYYRGMSKIHLQNGGLIEEALKDFFKAIELGSKHNGIFNGISSAYLKAKKYHKALIYSNICLNSYPNTEQFLIQRSLIYLQLQEYRKSIQDLTTALNVNLQNPAIYYRRGLAYYKNKQYEKAILDLQKSLRLNPSKNVQADIYYHIGIANSNLEKYQYAIQPLTKAIKFDPKPKYFHQRAKCSILIDENVNALNDLNQVIKAQPNNAFAYFRRGFSHKALKLYQEAAEDFLKARQLKPDDPRLIINKKQIYQTKYRKLCEAGDQQ